MAEGEATGRGSRGTGTKAKADEQVSGTHRLKDELEHYAEARLQMLLEGLGDRLEAGARRLGEAHLGPRGLTHAVARGGKKLGAHLPSGVGVLTSTASHAKETASHAKGTVVGRAKQATGQSDDADTETNSGHDKGKRSDPQSMGKGIKVLLVLRYFPQEPVEKVGSCASEPEDAEDDWEEDEEEEEDREPDDRTDDTDDTDEQPRPKRRRRV
ncbi:hypothetical protein [Streptomyces sp. NPDC057301]|uniref:hypothetical protein n=1 Tax=Streptomyces sp. NPDC057301 TaxID=3346093 RepID=UPI00363C320F